MSEFDVVILYSGGADSYLMLYFAMQMKLKPYCILMNYGQKHIEELDYASRQLKQLNIPWQEIDLVNYNVISGLTTGHKGRYEGVNQNNVPARNSIFLTIAAGIAENLQVNRVWIGCDMSDFYGGFPDCKQQYIAKMNEVFQIAFSYPIQIEAPLLGFTKEMVLEYLDKVVGIKPESLYTGYREFA